MRKNWAILGAGSIGCLWAVKLCGVGINTRLILTDERYRQLGCETVTLRLANTQQDFVVSVTSPEVCDQLIDILIVCTKAQQAAEAVHSIKHKLHADTLVLLLQNGLGSQRKIVKALPANSVWAGSITDGAYLQAPFVVYHAGRGVTRVGPLAGSTCRTEKDFLSSLDVIPLNIEIVDGVEQVLWNKLAANCCINGLTALYNCKNGELLDQGERHQHLRELVAETQLALKTLGKLSCERLLEEVERICKITANNISSTCYDVRNGRPTELAYINGFLIQALKPHAIVLQAHERLLAALKMRGMQI